MGRGGAALGMGALGPFVTILRILEPSQQLSRPEPFPEQHSPHYPRHLRPRDPGHLFPPSLLYYDDDWLEGLLSTHSWVPATRISVLRPCVPQ